jgi:hypothetical protein
MTEGIVYVLTNEAMPGYVKVGKTENSVAERIKSLDNTSLPLPFECYYAARVDDMDEAEKLVHDIFDDVRVTPRREFFNIDPERIRSALRLANGVDVTPGEEEVVEDASDRAALGRAKKRRENTNFGMLGIEPGTTLTFSKDPSVVCTVIDEKKIEFEGETTSVSRSALTILHRLGYEWPAVSGWGYWQYKGRKLSDLWLETFEGD